jgi:hypothetical protein
MTLDCSDGADGAARLSDNRGGDGGGAGGGDVGGDGVGGVGDDGDESTYSTVTLSGGCGRDALISCMALSTFKRLSTETSAPLASRAVMLSCATANSAKRRTCQLLRGNFNSFAAAFRARRKRSAASGDRLFKVEFLQRQQPRRGRLIQTKSNPQTARSVFKPVKTDQIDRLMPQSCCALACDNRFHFRQPDNIAVNCGIVGNVAKPPDVACGKLLDATGAPGSTVNARNSAAGRRGIAMRSGSYRTGTFEHCCCPVAVQIRNAAQLLRSISAVNAGQSQRQDNRS